jgi:AraC-like DNA-binding protein/quercetin dioxygenase-like cupin family protein
MAERRVLRMATYAIDPTVPAAVMFSNALGDRVGHSHEFYELVYVRGGGGVNIIDGRPYPMIQGDLLVMQPGDHHHFHSDPGSVLRIINVLFTPQLFPAGSWDELLALPGLAPLLGPRRGDLPRKLALTPQDARQVLALCQRMQSESAARLDDWRIAARMLITELLLVVARARAVYGALPEHAQPPDDPIARALARMHEDPAREVSVAALAREAGLTAAWFGERFKRQTGLGVRAYLVRLRLEEARRRLEEGASVTDAALAVGFQDPSYFARVFRRFAKLSPRDYRLKGPRAG